MIHLGSKVSALLDGRLPAAEEERCWAHVSACPPCRDLVEREGWIKTRLAGLSFDSSGASSSLKASLANAATCEPYVPAAPGRRVVRGVVAAGGSAVGVAVLGVLSLNAGAPVARPPAADIASPIASPSVTPSATTGRPPTRRTGAEVSWSPGGMVEVVVAMATRAALTPPDDGSRGGDFRRRDTMAR